MRVPFRPLLEIAQGVPQAPPGRVSESLEHIIDVRGVEYMQEMPSHHPVREEGKRAMNLEELAVFLVDAKVNTYAAQKERSIHSGRGPMILHTERAAIHTLTAISGKKTSRARR